MANIIASSDIIDIKPGELWQKYLKDLDWKPCANCQQDKDYCPDCDSTYSLYKSPDMPDWRE